MSESTEGRLTDERGALRAIVDAIHEGRLVAVDSQSIGYVASIIGRAEGILAQTPEGAQPPDSPDSPSVHQSAAVAESPEAAGEVPAMLSDLADMLGGRIDECGALPDGSGFATMSYPLPKTHWLYVDNGYDAPPMGLRMGTDHPDREAMNEKVRAAARYAMRGATMRGKEDDIDPDALVQNMIVGLLGYHTPDGLSSDAWANPKNIPPPAAPVALADARSDEKKDVGGVAQDRINASTEREAFEKWADANQFEKFRESMFAAWQARAALASQGDRIDAARWRAFRDRDGLPGNVEATSFLDVFGEDADALVDAARKAK